MSALENGEFGPESCPVVTGMENWTMSMVTCGNALPCPEHPEIRSGFVGDDNGGTRQP